MTSKFTEASIVLSHERPSVADDQGEAVAFGIFATPDHGECVSGPKSSGNHFHVDVLKDHAVAVSVFVGYVK